MIAQVFMIQHLGCTGLCPGCLQNNHLDLLSKQRQKEPGEKSKKKLNGKNAKSKHINEVMIPVVEINLCLLEEEETHHFCSLDFNHVL